MAKEIERKFLIDMSNDNLKEYMEDASRFSIIQGYLLNSESKVVRVRKANIISVKDDPYVFAFVTIKCKTDNKIESNEWEYSIPVKDANEMLKICGDFVIEKTRYIFPYHNIVSNLSWEIDIFHGYNDGLVVAEIELPSRDTEIELPSWIVKEVTYDNRYKNNNLVICPYTKWSDCVN